MASNAYTPPQKTNPSWIGALKSGKKVAIGCAINSSSSLATELVSSLGFDFLLIDAQHSAIDPEKLRYLLQACHCGGAKAFVRVGGCYDRIGIQQAFDLGADGILVPCAKTVEDVKHAVSCAKYPVDGPGSEGGTRSVYVNLRPQLPGGFPALFDYVQNRGNKETVLAFQIETASALEQVDAICKVPGVDIAFIGPGDLATDMGLVRKHGLPAAWSTPAFGDAVGKVLKACADNNVVPGFWNGDIAANAPNGFRFFVVDGEIHAMQAALAATLAEKKKDVAALNL